jgi:hypothetical protein
MDSETVSCIPAPKYHGLATPHVSVFVSSELRVMKLDLADIPRRKPDLRVRHSGYEVFQGLWRGIPQPHLTTTSDGCIYSLGSRHQPVAISSHIWLAIVLHVCARCGLL